MRSLSLTSAPDQAYEVYTNEVFVSSTESPSSVLSSSPSEALPSRSTVIPFDNEPLIGVPSPSSISLALSWCSCNSSRSFSWASSFSARTACVVSSWTVSSVIYG